MPRSVFCLPYGLRDSRQTRLSAHRQFLDSRVEKASHICQALRALGPGISGAFPIRTAAWAHVEWRDTWSKEEVGQRSARPTATALDHLTGYPQRSIST